MSKLYDERDAAIARYASEHSVLEQPATNGAVPNLKTDVFISGAGPVGLVLTYQLARLGLSTYTVDAFDKTSPDFPMYGRACTLMPRTLELLDQLDLFDKMAQEGVCSKRSVTYKDGQRVQGRGWRMFEEAVDTHLDFCLSLRLKYSEDIIREEIGKLGVHVHAPAKLVDYTLNESAADDYKVEVDCTDESGRPVKVNAKYIVGCDGGHSAVRTIGKIPFIGSSHENYWVRVDGVVKTNMPESRAGFGSIESATHGNVLWLALDHGATRIGYRLTPELYKTYGGAKLTEEDAVREAKNAMAPFEVEFTQVDWYTVYGIQQRVAETFQDRERILLAGDAAHTHSSAAAQGMNVGVHDAVSLGWRLGGVVKGWYKPEVLATYSPERRAIAQQLIDYDKDFSTLLSGLKPDRLKDSTKDVNVLWDELAREAAPFNSGLGIICTENLLNKPAATPIAVKPGRRGPDVLLQKPGPKLSVRLFDVSKNNGKFKIIVFVGNVASTAPSYMRLREKAVQHLMRFSHASEMLTIIAGSGQQPDEHLGTGKLGSAYWDVDTSAHERYGVSPELGALVVLRPDGILGFAARLEDVKGVMGYLDAVIVAPKRNGGVHTL